MFHLRESFVRTKALFFASYDDFLQVMTSVLGLK